MSWLLDTNVLSELRKGQNANSKVRKWASHTIGDQHFISALSLGEIRKGIELLRKKSPSQCPAFDRWLSQLQSEYADLILPISEEVADRWGRLMAIRTLPAVDGLIAATAMIHGLTIVTRNAADFKLPGLKATNPFE